jgi:hypothetical protein
VRLARHVAIIVAALAAAVPAVPMPGVSIVAAADPPWTTPTIPPRCTTAQVDAGTVEGCVVYGGRGRPDENGWPSPPFPDTVVGQPFPPAGWTFDGWSYTGSAALAGWEAGLATNTSGYGRIGAGRIDLLPDAMPLFDGFLREIAARGYGLRDGIGYNYRCTITSSTGCQNLTRTSLSFHAYGLAIDINGSQNPPRTYSSINGATACATPMLTDMPQWVVQVAEKWGLYWGGYGWSSGCASPDTQRTSVYRDPTHFEFRGTPLQARSIAARNGAGRSCVQVVDTAGTVSTRCPQPGVVPAAATRTVVDSDAPVGAASALVNIVATATGADGYVTAETCGAAPNGERAWANLNPRAGTTVANVAVVALDADGRFCLFQSSSTHLVVDVQGFFLSSASAPTGLTYRPMVAARSLDTRTDAVPPASGPAPVAGNSIVPVGMSLPGAAAVLANLAVTGASGDGYLTANRCGALAPGPQRSANVNFDRRGTYANLAVVAVDATPSGSGYCAYASQSTHLVADTIGWFGPAAGGGLGFAPLPQSRLLDTRGCRTAATSSVCKVPVEGGTIVRIEAPAAAGAAAVLANLVLVEPGVDGYATAGPCSTLVAGPQRTANINAAPGEVAANLAVVPVDPDGSFCVYTSVTSHLVVDLQGVFAAGADLRLTVVAPRRALDTRG